MKIRVRLFHHGLDRTQREGIRALALLVVAVPALCVLLGPATVTAAAAGAGAASAPGSGGGGHRDPHHRCGNSSAKRPPDTTPAPVATPAPSGSRRPATGREPEKKVSGSASHAKPAVPTTVSVIPRTTPAPAVERPPLLAPPVLAEPGPIAVVAVPASSVLIYAITVSALLGAAAVSIGALVHVRRSD